MRFLTIILFLINFVTEKCSMESVFDDELYDRVLDEETCKRQIELMQTPSIGNLFKQTNDAVPRDLNYPDVFFYSGNYQECLSINSVVNGTRIQGKYCQVEVEVPRAPPLPGAPVAPEAPEAPSNHTLRQQVMFAAQRHKLRLVYYIGCEAAIAKTESLDAWSWKPSLRVGVGVCVPHACRATRVWRDVQRAYAGGTGPVLRARGHPIEDPSNEVYCRLPNDITWHYTDSVALVAVCVVVILVASGTALDIRQRRRGAAGSEAAGPGRGECALGAWSAIRNGNQLAAEATADGGVRCVHGVRALSVIGVVLCHTLLDDVVVENFVIHDQWSNFKTVIIYGLPYVVDTFLLLSGTFVVYSTLQKNHTRGSLFRSVPRLYLGRLVRLYPVLIGALALQALALQAAPGGAAGAEAGAGGARGPVFAQYVAGCRRGWWPVLLFVQNLVYTCSPGEDTYSLCLDLSYYLAIDTQLFFLSPLVLVCLVEDAGDSGGARGAWAALFAALAGSLALASTISFYLNLPFVLSIDIVDPLSFDYYSQYYFHTLLRSPPYFIGMILGYVLHRSRKEPLIISKKCRISLWLTCGLLLALAGAAPLLCLRWQRVWLHNACNAAARSVWASAVAWIVVACHHNYGGIVSWFLSLAAWRPLSRLSYAVYLLHVPVLKLSAALAAADTVSVRDDFRAVKNFFFIFTVSTALAFALTVAVELPASHLLRALKGGNNNVADKPTTE